jgi:hypothetical protein
MRKETESENIRVNGAMVRNLLEVLAPKNSIQHVALVTGLETLDHLKLMLKKDFT